MATLETLLDHPLYGALTRAIAAEIELYDGEGFTADDVADAGPPAGLETEVFFLVADLPEHLQEDGAILARAELVRIWADEVREFASTRLAQAA